MLNSARRRSTPTPWARKSRTLPPGCGGRHGPDTLDTSQNARRFYRMKIVPGLFGDWGLVREWGRIGRCERIGLQ
ncbi:WGR domain-containing protein [Monaibacterium marinum]|uniref:WGR domain-containing protein n=1 Tax=Pontivivens marinum TaxID=1690039 RepID=UPI002481D233|nr:WGR domain-containing protein [Monaibacterium marinum]